MPIAFMSKKYTECIFSQESLEEQFHSNNCVGFNSTIFAILKHKINVVFVLFRDKRIALWIWLRPYPQKPNIFDPEPMNEMTSSLCLAILWRISLRQIESHFHILHCGDMSYVMINKMEKYSLFCR